MRKRLILTLCVTVVVLLAITAGPGLTQGRQPGLEGMTIPYTGQLSDETGHPADGAYDFRFALYQAETGGEAVWEETQVGVPLRDGNFAVLLGGANAIPKDLAAGDGLWLGVEVRGPGAAGFTALTPWQLLSATAPDSPDALSCIHTHFAEWWTGSSSQAGFIADNRTGTGDGIRGYANKAAANFGGVYGVNFANGPGVYGRSDGGGPGVAGYSSGRGVYGSGADGVVGESSTANKSGVYGVNSSATGYGVTGRDESYFGVLAWGSDASASDTKGDLLLQGNYGEIFTYGGLLDLYSNDRVVVDLDNDNNNAGSFFRVLSGSDGILWTVAETLGVVAGGRQASSVSTADYGDRLLYSVEGTGVWVEDIGTAALTKGEAIITFEPVFAQTVDLAQPYQVFVTAISEEPVWLYVSAKSAAGFTVRGVTLDGQPAECAFDYRVVAERLGYEDVRLESYDSLSAKGGAQ